MVLKKLVYNIKRMGKKLSDIMEIFDIFKHVQVYALVGESGTGKSFRSKLLAEQYGIHAIIDDGLLIQDEKIVAGRSAKREKTYMGAVRAALFDDKEHRDSVARVLRKTHIKKILLLGTSEKMVSKIAMRLQLPQPQKIIHIEEIAREKKDFTFTSLFEPDFDRSDIATTFLAILEMLSHQKLKARQDEMFGEIFLTYVEENADVVVEISEEDDK